MKLINMHEMIKKSCESRIYFLYIRCMDLVIIFLYYVVIIFFIIIILIDLQK